MPYALVDLLTVSLSMLLVAKLFKIAICQQNFLNILHISDVLHVGREGMDVDDMIVLACMKMSHLSIPSLMYSYLHQCGTKPYDFCG